MDKERSDEGSTVAVNERSNAKEVRVQSEIRTSNELEMPALASDEFRLESASFPNESTINHGRDEEDERAANRTTTATTTRKTKKTSHIFCIRERTRVRSSAFRRM